MELIVRYSMQPSGEMMYLCTVKRFTPILLFLLLAMTTLFSCEEEEPVLLPKSLMVEVLSELHIADAYTERNSNPIIYRNNLREDLYLEVLDKFQLDEVTFRETYDYYTRHPYQMDTLYQEVIENLENQMHGEKELKSQTPPPRRRTKEESNPEPAPRKAPWQNPDNASN